tara:strand:- start:887 stop:1600 length:714 start_codon:yes stop_codon:yes gene_type:complete
MNMNQEEHGIQINGREFCIFEVNNMQQVIERIREAGVIAILRGNNPGRLEKRAFELVNLGCKAIEVTLDSPSALDIVRKLSAEMNPEEVVIGVGTLLNIELIDDCIQAGAKFALSPVSPPHMIERCHEKGLLAIPGVSTPDEMSEAIKRGAQIIKLYPSSNWELDMLSGIDTPWIPVGGVNQYNIDEWLENGAFCVGMGTHLCGSDLDCDGEDDWGQEEAQVARGIFKELQRRGGVT